MLVGRLFSITKSRFSQIRSRREAATGIELPGPQHISKITCYKDVKVKAHIFLIFDDFNGGLKANSD